MKTSLVRWERGFSAGIVKYYRAALRTDSEEARKLYKTPHFDAAHSYVAHTYNSIEDLGNGKSRKVKRHEPDSLILDSCRYHFTGSICPKVRRLPEEIVERLDALDAEIAEEMERLRALRREEQEILEDGYLRGTPLRKDDVRIVPEPAAEEA